MLRPVPLAFAFVGARGIMPKIQCGCLICKNQPGCFLPSEPEPIVPQLFLRNCTPPPIGVRLALVGATRRVARNLGDGGLSPPSWGMLRPVHLAFAFAGARGIMPKIQ